MLVAPRSFFSLSPKQINKKTTKKRSVWQGVGLYSSALGIICSPMHHGHLKSTKKPSPDSSKAKGDDDNEDGGSKQVSSNAKEDEYNWWLPLYSSQSYVRSFAPFFSTPSPACFPPA